MEETQKQSPLLTRLRRGWFGGISSTKATLRMQARNSCKSKSGTSPITLTKCTRFILPTALAVA